LSFDYDVDPVMRKHSPAFYGYIPDGPSRTLIFGCMLLNSALLVLIRSFGAAMLLQANKIYLVIYMAGDMALYLGVKVARGDFHYWFPVYGAVGLVVSLLIRVIVKTITDFTGVIQFRHPAEEGGLYWTANMFLALAASFACVWVGGGGRLEFTLVGAASGAWVLVFSLFLSLAKKGFRRTFVSRQRGKDWAMEFFVKGVDDAQKSEVIGCNEHMWTEIRVDVKEWVRAGWWRWVDEKPDWMTESWIAKVPLDMVAEEAQAAARGSRRCRAKVGSFSAAVQPVTN